MSRARDAGSVTVELAMALPAVVSLLAVLLGVGSAAVGQLRLADGARAGARVAALGFADGEIGAAAAAAAGREVQVGVSRGGGLVTVRCEGQVWVPLLGGFAAGAEAVAACEPARGCG
jgi:hypothetical protein